MENLFWSICLCVLTLASLYASYMLFKSDRTMDVLKYVDNIFDSLRIQTNVQSSSICELRNDLDRLIASIDKRFALKADAKIPKSKSSGNKNKLNHINTKNTHQNSKKALKVLKKGKK